MSREHVDGIGGLFWRAKDPAATGAWYQRHFGIPADPAADGPWFPAAGPTVVSPFDAETDYFGGPQGHMVNFRVNDLAGLCKELAAAGHPEVKPRESMDGFGHFAWVTDPDGNRIELWQPDASD